MPSCQHEDIISQIRYAVANNFSNRWPETLCMIGQMAGLVLGAEGKEEMPDLVIIPPDKVGPIVVEVGNMERGKWSNVIGDDGYDVRVMRVDFDGHVSMIRPRRTTPEQELLRLLEQYLGSIERAF